MHFLSANLKIDQKDSDYFFPGGRQVKLVLQVGREIEDELDLTEMPGR